MNSIFNSGKSVVLASGSAVRRKMLEDAFVEFRAEIPNVDEEALRLSMSSVGARPRDIADAVADMKAKKVSVRNPRDFVIGCDQVLELEGKAYGKAYSAVHLRSMLQMMRGKTHFLHSAAVVYDGGQPVWRHTATARMTMREFSDSFLDKYLLAGGEELTQSVGCYRIEDGGASLLSKMDGDMFVILGMPLLELLAYLGRSGAIAT